MRVRTGKAWVIVFGLLAGAAWPGCAPNRPVLFDGPALLSARKAIVLPLSDSPGPQSDVKGSGQVVGGVLLTELNRLGKYGITNVTPEKLNEALTKTGYAVEDCYDPTVVAAVGKALDADVVVVGELTHYGKQQEWAGTTISMFSSTNTKFTHWVSLSIRIVRCSDAKTVYTGSGTASSEQTYIPAAKEASAGALLALKDLFQRGK